MTKPTTEELKDLLGKVTTDWRVSHVHDENGWYGSAVYMDDNEKVWLENDYNSDLHDATLIALAPTLAAEVVELRSIIERIVSEYYTDDNGRSLRWEVDIARQALSQK